MCVQWKMAIKNWLYKLVYRQKDRHIANEGLLSSPYWRRKWSPLRPRFGPRLIRRIRGLIWLLRMMERWPSFMKMVLEWLFRVVRYVSPYCVLENQKVRFVSVTMPFKDAPKIEFWAASAWLENFWIELTFDFIRTWSFLGWCVILQLAKSVQTFVFGRLSHWNPLERRRQRGAFRDEENVFSRSDRWTRYLEKSLITRRNRSSLSVVISKCKWRTRLRWAIR